MAKPPSDLQGSTIKSVCILAGVFADSLGHIEEYFIPLAISGTFPIIKAGKKNLTICNHSN